MKGKTFGVGALLLASGAIAGDARSWATGKLLDAIAPTGGWSFANVSQMPWGSIVGVPVFIGAACWLIWDTFGRTSFRARFGSNRALRDYIHPLEQEIIDAQKQIKSLFSALTSLKDRERLNAVADEVETAARSIDRLANDYGKLSGGQLMLLNQFHGDWVNSYSHWLTIARSYDTDLVDRLLTIPNGAFDRELPNAANLNDDDSVKLYQVFSAQMEAWRDARPEIEQSVEDAAFNGNSLFRRMGGTLPVIGEEL